MFTDRTPVSRVLCLLSLVGLAGCFGNPIKIKAGDAAVAGQQSDGRGAGGEAGPGDGPAVADSKIPADGPPSNGGAGGSSGTVDSGAGGGVAGGSSAADSGVDGTTRARMDSALDTPTDMPQLLPDSSDSYVADASADPPRSETRLDGLPTVGGIDGNAGTGGAVGSGGAIGTGGATGTGGVTGTGGATGTGGTAGSCGNRDCASDKDNDCNGTADNQEAPCKVCIPGNGQACSTGGLGLCAAGSQSCQLAADHQSVGWGACLQNVAKRSRDCTSSDDNDCNGTADNQEAPCKTCIPGNSQACGTGGLGICAAGTQTCQFAADHQSVAWGACLQDVAKRSRDCTSSNDNDCNGQADNTESTFCQCSAAGSPRSCSTGLSGICSAGSQVCVLSGDKSSSAWGTCTQVTPKGTETCANPGTDDNCDGIVDNVPVASCDVGGTSLGACANGGNTACSGTTQVCSPAVPGIGDPSAWHLTAAPNGSWDWDCDGYVTKQYGDTAIPPPTCTDVLDSISCNAQTHAYYSLNGPMACGQVGDIGSSYCYWLSVASACEPKTAPQAGQQQGCR